VETLVGSGALVVLPGVIDYEIRRELVRMRRVKSLAKLDALRNEVSFVAVDTETLTRAAGLWADARRMGTPTADDKHLDIDMILAAHALIIAEEHRGESVVVATTNVRHLSRFVEARHWGF
jgi:predicted nucleic acid-binding protein